MDDSRERLDALIRSGARRLTGYQRRQFQAEVATELCGGSPRRAERRFGWGRDTVEKGLNELRSGMRCRENFAAKGRKRSEQRDPQLAEDIRAIVEPHAYADPQLKSASLQPAADFRPAPTAPAYSVGKPSPFGPITDSTGRPRQTASAGAYAK